MSGDHDKEKSLRMISRGRKRIESDQIKKLREEESFNPENSNRYRGVSQTKSLPLPNVSPVEVASIAATLLATERDAKEACRTALILIRESSALIEQERINDAQTQRYLEDNEANRRMWRNIGLRIETNPRGKKKGKTFRGVKGAEDSNYDPRNPDFIYSSLYPFPISRVELYALAGVESDAGRKRLDSYLKDLYENEDITPEEGSAAYKAHKDSHKTNGIDQIEFLQFAKTWPELREVMKECAKKK